MGLYDNYLFLSNYQVPVQIRILLTCDKTKGRLQYHQSCLAAVNIYVKNVKSKPHVRHLHVIIWINVSQGLCMVQTSYPLSLLASFPLPFLNIQWIMDNPATKCSQQNGKKTNISNWIFTTKFLQQNVQTYCSLTTVR